ncbi:MAG: hypothetical protein AB7O21_06110 [Gammaproteobacteria bacterium]
MTEYELTNAFLSHAGLLLTYFMAFVSATSALLVVAYFAGTNLPVLLSRVVVGIYASTSLFLMTSFQRQSALFLAVREQMRPHVDWHTAVTEPAWILPTMLWLGLATMLAVFAGGIWYFYAARNQAVARG